MTTITKIAAAAVAAFTIGHAAAAQDFTNIDVTGMNNEWNASQNAMMNAQLGQIIWQNMNDPRVQAMYQQHVAQGLFWGTLEQFAYKYAYTGGMSEGGYATVMGVNRQLDSDFQGQMAGAAANTQGYYDAYGNWVQGYANNQATAGAMMIYGN